jgi:hypothetical protein
MWKLVVMMMNIDYIVAAYYSIARFPRFFDFWNESWQKASEYRFY